MCEAESDRKQVAKWQDTCVPVSPVSTLELRRMPQTQGRKCEAFKTIGFGAETWAQMSGRQIPGLTRGLPPFYVANAGGELWVKLGVWRPEMWVLEL
jgi:hypothetical protein